MKDTVLTARRKKIEIITLLVCFVLANLVNLYAIIAYNRSMMEMITSIFYIIIFAFCSLCLLDASAPPFYGVKALLTKKKNRL